jgi:putative peptidoglycan lipid II flippase
LQRPWLPTTLALGSLVVNVAVSVALYKPLGIAGLVLGTGISNAVLTLAEARWLRAELVGLEVTRGLISVAGMLEAAVVLGFVAYGTWSILDHALGRSLPAQIVSTMGGIALGAIAYAAVVLALGLPEARQVRDLFKRRLRRS